MEDIILDANRIPSVKSAAPSENRVGVGLRFLAVLIDGQILYVACAIIGSCFDLLVAATGGKIDPAWLASLVILATSAFGFTYSLSEILLAGTPGKRICRIEIRSADGTPATFSSLGKRWLAKNAQNFLLLLVVILPVELALFLGIAIGLYFCADGIAILLTRQQSIHDMLSGTAVFKRDYFP